MLTGFGCGHGPRCAFVGHDAERAERVEAADNDGRPRALRLFDGAALDEVASFVGQPQGLLPGQRGQRGGVGVDVGVLVEVPGHVLDQFAAGGAQPGGQKNGRQVRPAAAEADDGVVLVPGEEPRHDDDLVARQPLVQRRGVDAEGALVPRQTAGDQPALVDVKPRGADAQPLQVQREQGDGAQFGGGPQQVEGGAAGVGRDGAGEVEQLVGLPALGRDDDEHALPRAALHEAGHELRGPVVRGQPGEDGPADLDDDDFLLIQ